MSVKSLQILFLGSQNGTDKGFMTFGVDIGKKMVSPFLCFLIKADEGNILVDAGLHPDDAALMARMGPISLPPENLLPEVFDFIQFLEAKEERTLLVKASQELSSPVFEKIWNNDQDAVYDSL